MLFGEKYGEKVRVITFDENYSIELCGGTHVGATGEIGYFRFISESSVAAGVRRIEAICGKTADNKLRAEKKLMRQILGIIGQTDDAVSTLKKLIDDKKSIEKELSKLQMVNSSNVLDTILSNVEVQQEVHIFKGEIPDADVNTLKQLGYEALQKRTTNSVIILASKNMEQGKVFLMVAVSDDLIKTKNIKAGIVVGKLGRLVGGGGGGQPNLATAGGKNPEKLNEALSKAGFIINELI